MKLLFCQVLIFAQFLTFGQKTIYLENGSFEGVTGANKVPIGWDDLGFKGHSPPDTHPTQVFQVTKKAYHGDTYLGLVTRSDNSWESVGQVLSPPLMANDCYIFSIYLARSTTYVSAIKRSGELINYKNPVQLEIWGGEPNSPKSELLAKSEGVINTNWLEYNFKISPSRKHKYVFLEARFIDGSKKPYAGNILLDFASDFDPIDCVDEVMSINSTEIEIEASPSDSLIAERHRKAIEKRKPAIKKPTFNSTHRSIHRLWEDVKFIAFSDELTKGGKLALSQIATQIKYGNGSITIVLVKGEGDLRDDRINNLIDALYAAGLDKNHFSVKAVRPSDLQRSWYCKNYYLWARYSMNRWRRD